MSVHSHGGVFFCDSNSSDPRGQLLYQVATWRAPVWPVAALEGAVALELQVPVAGSTILFPALPCGWGWGYSVRIVL